MINVSGVSYEEFMQKMIEIFNQETASKGYEIIINNREVCYEENSEQLLQNMLKGLKFQDEYKMKQFIDYVTTFIIVSNMKI